MATAFLILVGSYTNFISSLRFAPGNSSLTYVTQTPCGGCPSWISQHPDNLSIIYATQEVYYAPGIVYSLVVNASNGALTQVSSISTGTTGGAAGTVYVEAINNGTAIAAANYNSGSTFVVALGSDKTSFSGAGQVIKFTGSGPLPNQASAHAHQTIGYNNEILVPDLGSDMVRRLANLGSSWAQSSSVTFTRGSGPRHIIATNGTQYTLHQNYNVLTQNIFPSISSGAQSQLVANVSIIPPGTTSTSNMQAGELLYAPSACSDSPSPLLYATNRNDPSPLGDAITVFETTPMLKAVAYIRTGLQHLRGMAFVGLTKEYIVVGGMNGGGIKNFRRVGACQGYLTEVAALAAGQVSQPTAFVGISLP